MYDRKIITLYRFVGTGAYKIIDWSFRIYKLTAIFVSIPTFNVVFCDRMSYLLGLGYKINFLIRFENNLNKIIATIL